MHRITGTGLCTLRPVSDDAVRVHSLQALVGREVNGSVCSYGPEGRGRGRERVRDHKKPASGKRIRCIWRLVANATGTPTTTATARHVAH